MYEFQVNHEKCGDLITFDEVSSICLSWFIACGPLVLEEFEKFRS